MRILRLTTSDELSDILAPGERQYQYAERFLSERLGEPVSTVLAGSWPSNSLPGAVSALIDEHKPDLVYLIVNNFSYNFPSTALRLKRRLGWLGPGVSRALTRAGGHPVIGHSRAARWTRMAARRLIGAEAYFEPDHVVDVIEETMKRALRDEGTIAAIYGPSVASFSGDWGSETEAEVRREIVSEGIREMAERLHVHYVYWRKPIARDETTIFGHGDELHGGWLSQAGGAVIDDLVLSTAVREQRGEPGPDLNLIGRMDALRADPSSPFFGRVSEDYVAFLRTLLPRVSLSSPHSGMKPFH